MAESDEAYMQQAIDLAKRGEGSVEPNPMVGCVLVRDDQVIGSGWHQVFGGPHAEVDALQSTNNDSNAVGATAFVTLEPCSHIGKTGPCADALIKAKVARVVIACVDPNPLVAGKGVAKLRAAGVEVETSVLTDAANELLAPYLKRTLTGMPWIIAKWAMTLDGKIATASGDSKWISNPESRAIVHQIRGRADGVMVGSGTAIADDPMLNARPEGVRVATRIVIDSLGKIPSTSKLATTARDFPTLIAVGPAAEESDCNRLRELGCSIFQSNSNDSNERLRELLLHLGELGMTNVLVEGGGRLLGSLNDIAQIDEYHVFIGPLVAGGSEAISPIGGSGHSLMKDSSQINVQEVRQIGSDTYIVARTR